MNQESRDERIIAAAIYGVSYFTAFIGPIVIWFLKKDESSYIDFHGRQYFNFLISFIIYYVIGAILSLILIGILIIWILGILQLIFTIVAALKAFEGKEYQIPLALNIIK